MSKEVKIIVGAILAVIALIAFLILNPIVKIDTGERGVKIRWGAVQDEILDEGIHWVFPQIMYEVKKMDVTIQKEERGASASSKDLQIVTSKIAINYHLDPTRVNKVYQTLKRDYSDRVISPAIEEFVKKITAQYTAEELVTKRESVKQDLKRALTENLNENGIIVDDLFITDFDFSDQFNTAIEAKVTAEQSALEAENKLKQVEFEADQRVATAQAEATAIKIQAEAITSQGGKEYVQLKWIEAWAQGGAKVPQFMTSDQGGGFIFNMNK